MDYRQYASIWRYFILSLYQCHRDKKSSMASISHRHTRLLIYERGIIYIALLSKYLGMHFGQY